MTQSNEYDDDDDDDDNGTVRCITNLWLSQSDDDDNDDDNGSVRCITNMWLIDTVKMMVMRVRDVSAIYGWYSQMMMMMIMGVWNVSPMCV